MRAGVLPLGVLRGLAGLLEAVPAPRRAREGTAQVRPQEGPQGPAVLQAVTPRRASVLRFGTDGVRGDAEHDLTTPFVVALGRAVARVLRSEQVVVGRDTRASGPRIEAALAIGLRSE